MSLERWTRAQWPRQAGLTENVLARPEVDRGLVESEQVDRAAELSPTSSLEIRAEAERLGWDTPDWSSRTRSSLALKLAPPPMEDAAMVGQAVADAVRGYESNRTRACSGSASISHAEAKMMAILAAFSRLQREIEMRRQVVG